jgi:hypothetical protein
MWQVVSGGEFFFHLKPPTTINHNGTHLILFLSFILELFNLNTINITLNLIINPINL